MYIDTSIGIAAHLIFSRCDESECKTSQTKLANHGNIFVNFIVIYCN